MIHSRSTEKGQAIVLLVFGMVALLGFTSLAIDGGMVYSERRHSQNAADAASLAGALALVNGQDWQSAAYQRARDNGFDNNGVTNTVEVYRPPNRGPYKNNNEYVQVIIHSRVETSLIQFVYNGPVENTVEAVARAKPSSTGPMFNGNAIVGLSPHGDAVVKSHGNPATYVYGSGIFVNSDDADNAFWQTGSGAVNIEEPHKISVVGGAETSSGGVQPSDAIATGAVQMPYPPGIDIPPPTTCDYTVASLPLTLEDGKIYCVTGSITVNAGDILYGHNVLIYLINGSDLTINGNATINLDAPDSGPYKGLLIYVDPQGFAADIIGDCTVKINGTSTSTYVGTIYAPTCDVSLEGTGDASGFHSQIIGYSVDLGGTSDLQIHYTDEENYDVTSPAMLDLAQ